MILLNKNKQIYRIYFNTIINTIKIIPKTVHAMHIEKTTIITAIITLFKDLSIEEIFKENFLKINKLIKNKNIAKIIKFYYLLTDYYCS